MFKKIGIGFIIILAGGFIYFIMNFGPIISGFGAKAVCSCVYVGNRSVESAVKNELGAFPLTLGSFEVNEQEKSATGSVFGLAKATAIYRQGLGCTLVRELKESEIRSLLPELKLDKPALSSDQFWPLGTKVADTVPNGLDLDQLNQVVNAAFENTHAEIPAKTRSVLVVYKGQLVAEKYASEFSVESVQLGWSMTKSVTNILYGILEKQGTIDISKPANLSEWENDERSSITTDQLLRMSSGLYWEEVYSNVSTATNMLYKYADMGNFAMSQKQGVNPDSEWYYSSGTTNILAKMMRDKLGDENYYQFAQRELFSPIGVTSAVIEPDASGTFVASSYMWANTRDWARLGLLYLNKGNWFGNQIVDSSWVEYTIQPTPGAPVGQYGAQWWLNAGENGNPQNRLLPNVPTDMYMMDGYEGQRVFVVPSSDLVVVRLGQNKKGGFDHDKFLSSVISCVKK